MKFEDLIHNSKDGAVSRRQFNQMLASLGLASATMAGVSKPALAASSSLDLFTWSGYDAPEMYTEYSAQYGDFATLTRMTSNNESRAKVRGGFTPDLAAPSWSHGTFWMDDGLVEPVDISRLPRWSELFTRLQNLEAGDQKHFVPLAWGNTAVVYRTDLVPEDITEDPSWGILWDERLKGKIAIRDAFMGAMLPAALYGGVGNAYDMTDDELVLVGDLLRQQRDLTRFYWKAEADAQQALASGEIAVISGWNSTYATLKKEGVPVGFMAPKEGMPTWVDGYMMIKGGDATEQEKYDFLHATMSAEAGKHLIEEIGYGAANAKSFDISDPEKIATLGIGDVNEVVERGLWSVAVPLETKDKMVDLYNRVKSGF